MRKVNTQTIYIQRANTQNCYLFLLLLLLFSNSRVTIKTDNSNQNWYDCTQSLTELVTMLYFREVAAAISERVWTLWLNMSVFQSTPWNKCLSCWNIITIMSMHELAAATSERMRTLWFLLRHEMFQLSPWNKCWGCWNITMMMSMYAASGTNCKVYFSHAKSIFNKLKNKKEQSCSDNQYLHAKPEKCVLDMPDW